MNPRRLLLTACAAILPLALSLSLPATSLPAAARVTSPAQAAASPVTHIVILMQENHTFDSELGYWCNANPGRCPDGGMPASVTLSNGAVVTPGVTPDIVPNLVHSVAAQTAAINGGAMNGWQNVSGCAAPAYACISGYQPSAVPNLAALATKYAIADRAFTLADSPSFGGHAAELAGTTDGFSGDNPTGGSGPGWGCDSGKTAKMLTGPPQPSCVPDYQLSLPNGGAFKPTTVKQVPTILTEMDTAGVSWKIYAAPSGGGYIWSACPTFASCRYTSEFSNLVTSSRFFTDAAAGTLPSVSFLMPAGSNTKFSQHNGNSNAAGDNWIGKVASAVMASPSWSSTALLITYDDCGCFYDQVPPPLAPDGRQMGPRVPFLVVSPYAKPGFTDTTSMSSTGSILAFIESTFGLPALGVNDAGAYNLSGMFNFAQAPRQPVRMTWRKLPPRDYRLNPATLRDGT